MFRHSMKIKKGIFEAYSVPPNSIVIVFSLNKEKLLSECMKYDTAHVKQLHSLVKIRGTTCVFMRTNNDGTIIEYNRGEFTREELDHYNNTKRYDREERPAIINEVS